MSNLREAIIAELSKQSRDLLEVFVTHLQRVQQVGTVFDALGTCCMRDKHVHYLGRLQTGLTMQMDSAPGIVPNEAQLVTHIWGMNC